MEIKIIKVVFRDSKDIKPVGTVLIDEYGKIIICSCCNNGTLYIEWETGLTKCTMCNYEK
jgi:hypothetical protein